MANPGNIVYVFVNIFFQLPAFIFFIFSYITMFLTGGAWFFYLALSIFFYIASVFILSFTLVDVEKCL